MKFFFVAVSILVLLNCENAFAGSYMFDDGSYVNTYVANLHKSKKAAAAASAESKGSNHYRVSKGTGTPFSSEKASSLCLPRSGDSVSAR